MSQAKRGRPKGALNRVTNEAKQAILMAFEQLGGVRRLVEWVKADAANEMAYWTKIFTRLLPRPAVDAVPAPEARPPVSGALTWKTPDWVKELRRKGILQAGVAAAAGAGPAARSGCDPPPDEGP